MVYFPWDLCVHRLQWLQQKILYYWYKSKLISVWNSWKSGRRVILLVDEFLKYVLMSQLAIEK